MIRERLAAPLAWSHYRCRMFRRCPREYYLHYFATIGALAQPEDSPQYHLYCLKRLQSARQWTLSLFRRSVHKAMYERITDDEDAPPQEFLPLLETLLFQTLYRRRRQLLLEEWQKDPADAPNLMEFYYDKADPKEIFHTATEVLRCYFQIFSTTVQQYKFDQINPFQLLQIDSPEIFQLGDAEVYLTSDWVYRCKGKLIFVELNHPSPAEQRELGALQKYFALYRCRIHPGNVAGYFLPPGSDKIIQVQDEELNLSEFFERVQQESAAMLSLSHYQDYRDVPTGTEAQCQHCRFREICQASKSN